jgi:hypothetical protein
VAIDNSIAVSLISDGGVINVPNKTNHKIGSWGSDQKGQYTAAHFNMKTGDYMVQEDGKYSIDLNIECLDVIDVKRVIPKLVLKTPGKMAIEYSFGCIYGNRINLKVDIHASKNDMFWLTLENHSGKDISLSADKARINSGLFIRRFA